VSKDSQHERLLAIVKTLPGAYEDWPWGSIHCKVDGKIFAGWGRDDDGTMVLGIRTDREQQAALVRSDPRFSIAKYVGKYGGMDMKLGPKPDWAEVEHFIVQSYRIMAPKKRLKELDAAGGGGGKTTRPSRARAPGAKRGRRPSVRG
jgi:predicted DNA-binding protein (MmcQ/YjbR family)